MLLLSLLVIAGGSTQGTRTENVGATRPVVKALKDFTVEMAPEAKLQLADNVKFDINALRSTLQRTLEGNSLMAPDGNYRLNVVVNDIRVRSTFNAVMWGFMAGNDHLTGDVIVLNLAGEPAYNFEASASYALGGLGGGQDASRMNWLYEEFSAMIANELLQKKVQ
jgi:hypothetical protein